MPFEMTEKVQSALDALMELASPMDRGDTIPYEAIQRVLGVRPHEGYWQHCIYQWNRRMESERGITIWNVREVGYELLTRNRQLQVPNIRIRRARRQIRRGLRSVASLPVEGLSLHQMRLRQVTIEQSLQADRDLDRQLRIQHKLRQATPTLPRRNPHHPDVVIE